MEEAKSFDFPKAKQRLRTNHGNFRRSFLWRTPRAQTEGTNVISLNRDTLHHSTGSRQPAARLDGDQHAAFFQGQQEPTQLVMTQERRSKVQTLLIILSQRYQTPTWHAIRRSAVCSLQLWNGMVAQKEGEKKTW